MKEIIAYTLMCPNEECKCGLPLRNLSGMIPIFESETQAQLAISNAVPVPIIKQVKIVYED